MCHQVGDVVDEIEERKSDRNFFFKTEIRIFIEILDEDWIMELEKSKGENDLQAISKIDLLVECNEKNLESLRGAVGLSDFFKRKALCILWGYVTPLVYFEVG